VLFGALGAPEVQGPLNLLEGSAQPSVAGHLMRTLQLLTSAADSYSTTGAVKQQFQRLYFNRSSRGSSNGV